MPLEPALHAIPAFASLRYSARFSEAQLDRLRTQGDPLADQVEAQLGERGDMQHVHARRVHEVRCTAGARGRHAVCISTVAATRGASSCAEVCHPMTFLFPNSPLRSLRALCTLRSLAPLLVLLALLPTLAGCPADDNPEQALTADLQSDAGTAPIQVPAPVPNSAAANLPPDSASETETLILPVDGCEQPGEPCDCADGAVGETACSEDGLPGCFCPREPICWPGEVLACTCDDGSAGTARCDLDATEIGECVCEPHLDAGYALPDGVACAIERRCSTCHGETPTNDAPMRLLTWDDFHAPTPSQPEVPVYIWMADRVGRDDVLRMPPPGSRAVSGLERDTLIEWARAGAPPASSPESEPEPPEGPQVELTSAPFASNALQFNCWSCHSATQMSDAPMPLTTRADFLAPAVSDPSKQVYELVRDRITRTDGTQMPPTGMLLEPWLTGLLDWIDPPPPAPEDCSPLL